MNEKLIAALRNDAESANADYSTPLTLGNHLDAAADALEMTDAKMHGRWVEAMQGEMHLYPDGQKMCNVCHTIMPSTWKTMPPFCFGCGAKIDGEV